MGGVRCVMNDDIFGFGKAEQGNVRRYLRRIELELDLGLIFVF